MSLLKGLLRFLASLKLAVIVIVSLSAALAAATLIESSADTRSAQYLVYRSWWFEAVLAALGVNIFAVMISRIPWKRRHLPFLLAHIGILMLLLGSKVTQVRGLDGNLVLTEGQSSAAVELENFSLYVSPRHGGASQVQSHAVPWVPTEDRFRPFEPYPGLKVDRMIPHAEPEARFVPAPANERGSRAGGSGRDRAEYNERGSRAGGSGRDRAEYSDGAPAVQLRLSRLNARDAMAAQDFWLWSGDGATSHAELGPARFFFVKGDSTLHSSMLDKLPGPWLWLQADTSGTKMSYRSRGSDGKERRGEVRKDEKLDPGWKGGVSLQILDLIPRAIQEVTYHPSRIQRGQGAPPAAIHLASIGTQGIWLGLGDRAAVTLPGGEVLDVSYFPNRVMLPFALKLDRFKIDRYEGTMNPMSYESSVSVVDGQDSRGGVTISMNEPLQWKGFTFYQASYEDAEPRPVTSILSVNQDPGRWLKYSGSLMIVLGSVLLFAKKYYKLT